MAGLAASPLAVLAYPNIDPVLVTLGPLEIRWYGLAYVVGFIAAGLVARNLAKRWKLGLSAEQVLDVVLAAVVGVVVGGRLGYVLFYGNLSGYLADPISILRLWDGGMSFHGGLVGALLMGWIAARRLGVPFLRLADVGAVGAPIGLFLGRLGNFVNGELWGRVTEQPWGMVFPGGGPLPRHPSQLYEAFLEGLVMFSVLFWLSRRKRPDGMIIGTLLVLYTVFRFAVEFVREPDVQLGFVIGPFTMGQLLSFPMLLGGVWLLWRAARQKDSASVSEVDRDAEDAQSVDDSSQQHEEPGSEASGD